MSTKKSVEHPSWCDRELCTAGEFHPTREEYAAAGPGGSGSHQSAPVVFGSYSEETKLQVSISQSVCPWETSQYVNLRTGDGALRWSNADEEIMGLFELLAQPVAALARKYPQLYGERFGWVLAKDEPTGDYCGCSDPECPSPGGQYTQH